MFIAKRAPGIEASHVVSGANAVVRHLPLLSIPPLSGILKSGTAARHPDCRRGS